MATIDSTTLFSYLQIVALHPCEITEYCYLIQSISNALKNPWLGTTVLHLVIHPSACDVFVGLPALVELP